MHHWKNDKNRFVYSFSLFVCAKNIIVDINLDYYTPMCETRKKPEAKYVSQREDTYTIVSINWEKNLERKRNRNRYVMSINHRGFLKNKIKLKNNLRHSIQKSVIKNETKETRD